eukprot:gene19561-25461_t
MFSISDKTKKKELSKEDQASLLSRIFLVYLNDIFKKGVTGNLNHSDLGSTSIQDQAHVLYDDFMIQWKEEVKKPKEKRSLWYVLWRTVGYQRAVFGLLLYAVYAAFSFGPVIILNKLTQDLQGTEKLSAKVEWILVALLFVLPVVGSVCQSQSNIVMNHIGIQFRNVLINVIYRKSLRLSPSARQVSSTGQIINMFSNDTNQLQRFMQFANIMVIAPAQIAVCLALLYQIVGVATFVGLALMIVLFPFTGAIFGFMTYLRTKKVKVTDVRVKLMNEILNGIRVIKNYAWEQAFHKKINVQRMKELDILKQLAYVSAIGFTIILMAAPILLPVVMFYTYIKLGHKLDSATAFTALSLFNLLQFPFTFLPLGLAMYSQSLVSTRRMLNFFIAEELEPYIDTDDSKEQLDGYVIKLTNVCSSWLTEEAVKLSIQPIIEVDKQNVDTLFKNDDKGIEIVQLEEGKTYAELPTNEDTSVEKVESNNLELKSPEVILDEKIHINRAINTINNVNLDVKRGQLVAIVGSVGSGKSSFLSTMLGELHLTSGYVRVLGNVAYCDQRPWILNATVKDNILFGKPYDEAKFNTALHAANLYDDIKVLQGGVNTEIGERGINLSGGQKARVALARAVYGDADVYFLDDPLSAVDAHVGQHIFHECIMKTLANKTRILVTHHVHLLNQCDLIVVLEEGSIKACGTYDELSKSGLDISKLVPQVDEDKNSEGLASPRSRTVSEADYEILVAKEIESRSRNNSFTDENNGVHNDEESFGVQAEKVLLSEESYNNVEIMEQKSFEYKPLTTSPSNNADEPRIFSESRKRSGSRVRSESSGNRSRSVSSVTIAKKTSNIQSNANDNRSSLIMTVEEQKLGDVSNSTYIYYIKSGGYFYFFLICVLLLVSQGFQLATSFWLAYWGSVNNRDSLNNHPLSTSKNVYFLNIFATFSCTSVILHENLLKRILNASIGFFDTTPMGRILNRFSSDMLVIDEELSQSISQVVNTLISSIGSLAIIVGSTKGTFLVLLVPIVIIYYRIQKYFRKTNTTVARLESISRSPIYADFSQALNGLNSIRAYNEQTRFVHHLEKQLDSNTIAGITISIASEWLSIRLDILGGFTNLFIAIIALATRNFIPASFMALALSNSFQVTFLLKFCVRMIAQFEAQMNSVERVMYYTQNVDQEGLPDELDEKEIPVDWPSKGTVVGKNIQMKYREGPLVLKGIDFDIKSSEKIGIAGRTGSGKSSMMIALFRIQELFAGSISIDGIDISKVPLHVLRSKLGIIPQDPVMFSASIRFNLDPFDQHTDEELWTVLESVNMKGHVLSLPNKLLEEVAEGGDNFSAGQRQLICIARAILRHPKILVLDEATASIDNETDALVQTMVREQFKQSTVLTIAHRLHTIIDSDRIMVLDAGNLIEFDSAEVLTKNENGLFKALWDRHQ